MSGLITAGGFAKTNSASQRNRWPAFLAATVAANLVVVFLSPNIVIPPRPSKQAATLLAAIAVYCFPFFVGLVELVLYRISAERAVSYLALGLSFLWLLGAIDAAATLWSDWSFE